MPLIEFDRCQALSAAINLRLTYAVQKPIQELEVQPNAHTNFIPAEKSGKQGINEKSSNLITISVYFLINAISSVHSRFNQNQPSTLASSYSNIPKKYERVL